MKYKLFIFIIQLAIISSSCLNIERDYGNEPEKPNNTILKDKVRAGDKDITNYQNEVIEGNTKDSASRDRIRIAKEEEKKTKATMRQEHVKSLRSAIDLFKKNHQPNEFLHSLAIDPSKDPTAKEPHKREVYSMKRMLDEGYLDGKFVLFRVDDEKHGSVILEIMFRHKQDNIFHVWMYYDKIEDSFIVRSIYVPSAYDENDLRLHRKLYSIYLNDDNFGV